jgi:hypothetical protein
MTTTPSDAPTPDITAGPGTPASGRRAFGRWPFGIIAVSVLRLVDAGALIYLGIEQRGLDLTGFPILGNSAVLTRTLDVTLAVLTIAGVVGLLAFKRWGWVLTMVLVGMSLLGDLIRVAIGEPGYLGLALHVLTAFYLNGRAVRALADRHLDDDLRAHP